MAIDPGASHMGMAILDFEDEQVKYVYSTYWACHRSASVSYQNYRLAVVKEHSENVDHWIQFAKPDLLVNEVLPVMGFNNVTQVFLAHAALGATQALAYTHGLSVQQISALTVKTHIGGVKNATKVKVRNGVLSLLPELAHKKSEWTTVFDESDAIAIGLAHLGYDTRN